MAGRGPQGPAAVYTLVREAPAAITPISSCRKPLERLSGIHLAAGTDAWFPDKRPASITPEKTRHIAATVQDGDDRDFVVGGLVTIEN